MDYVYLEGGIGNQMFQYAFYTALKDKGHKVKLDSSTLFKYLYKKQRCNIYDAFVLDEGVRTMQVKWQRMMERLPYLHSHGFLRRTLWKYVGIFQENGFDASLLDVSRGYFEGIWITYKYFADCQEKVRDAFRLRLPLPENNLPFLEQIQNEEMPVSIHVRLGDFLSPEWAGFIGNVCSQEYYQKAVKLILDRYPNAKFYVFSNEIEKAMKMLDGIDCVAVDVNDEKVGWADLFLMSQCKHNIIANSTFSWWGAWLNNYPSKMVVVPTYWSHLKVNEPNICPDDWIRI